MKKTIFLLLLIAAFSSCKKENNNTTQGDYESGVFITNEGPFSNGTGTVSFYNRETGDVRNNIFEVVNNRPLGNIVQSIEVFNERAYIVVNNSSKVEVVNASDFVSAGVIENIGVPRFFLGVSEHKGYLTDWNSGIKVINLDNYSVTSTIETGGIGAEQMKLIGNEVFVANLGGFGNDSTISSINTTTDALTSTISVGDRPQSLTIDANGKLWILCSGFQDWLEPLNDTPGKLVRINPSTKTVELTFTFPSNSDHPLSLVSNASINLLYYSLNGGIFEMDINANQLPTAAIINRSFYNLGIDPVSGYLFGSNALDFVQDGYVVRYNLSNGNAIDSIQTGIIPGNFYFN